MELKKTLAAVLFAMFMAVVLGTPARADTNNPYQEICQNITPEEEDLLCKILWAEANNQDMDGQRAVLEVIFNRVLSSSFPDSIELVLSQNGQFSTWKDRNNVEYTHVQLDALQIVSEEATVLPNTKYVFFDTQGKNGRDKIKIGNHWFGAEK